MSLIVGLILIVLGAIALWAWSGAFIIFLKGLIVFSLFLWGLMSLIVGYARSKAKRQMNAAFKSGGPIPTSEETLPPTA
ncbi:hypothetical protein EON83_02670 [bacterium]|nr:MAG: hypothetical protein EON83_02670 [bacterium]